MKTDVSGSADLSRMKLFQCRAVMPRHAHEDVHQVRTYVTVADCWEDARAQVQAERPDAEFVTIPVETSGVLLIADDSMSAREAADLHSACNWRERQSTRHPQSVRHAGSDEPDLED